jgi:hypothetical protein
VSDPYARLQKVARRAGQRGHFTADQAQAAGWSRMQLARAVRRGSVQRVAHTVYRFRVRPALDWKDDLAVELLSTGGLACGLTGTALYGLNAPPPKPQVMSARGSRHATEGRHHSSRDLPPHERVTVGGFACLAPIRAVLDAAHRVPRSAAVAIVESAIVRGLLKPARLEQRARELRHNKRPGCAIVLGILEEIHPELTRARNEWEALVVRRARELGLPPPELQYEVVIDGRRYVLDAAWSKQLATLEFDGRDPHMRRRVHDYDTGRRNDLLAAGWSRFGITAAALQRGDDRAFRQVATALAAADQASGTTRASHA